MALGFVSNTLLMIVAFQFVTGCKDSSFAGGGSPAKKKPVVVKEDPATPAVTETFKLDGETRAPLDLVWVIDNSGSMTDNIAQVRSNFDAFMASVSSRVDVKVILLSRASGTLGLQLPPSAVAQGGVQVDVAIGSYDGALMAAAMSCPPGGSAGLGSLTLCGVPVEGSGLGSSKASLAAGKFLSHFRPNASRAYVFVTDDESEDITGSDFVKAVTASAGGKTPKVFSFRGISEADSSFCNISSVGAQFDVMEKATGGAAFDICLPDWKPSFGRLAESINTAAKLDVTLKGPVDPATVRVFLGSDELPKTDYVLNGLSISFLKPLDKTKTYDVKVMYQIPKA